MRFLFAEKEHGRDQRGFHIAPVDPKAIFESVDVLVRNAERRSAGIEFQRVRACACNARSRARLNSGNGPTDEDDPVPGLSRLKQRRESKQYNQTLLHVYEIARATVHNHISVGGQGVETPVTS